jgi:NAD(P)-dependent dehydrogenase (short-subunit alcohol dehydrogenase family)
MELKGKTAIITGASGRLGFEIASGLGRAGCNCVCHYNKNKARAEELARQLCQSGVAAVAVQADLADPVQIERLFEKALGIGTPQILVNSAAVFWGQPLKDVDAGKAENIFTLNLTAPILVSGVFARKIAENFGSDKGPAGKIINIADVGAIHGWAGYVLYCSSKAGLIGATKSMAKELAPAICVNAIAPGIIRSAEDFDQQQLERQLSFIPAGRVGQASDIVNALIFLLESDYITGQVLNVDGGRCI